MFNFSERVKLLPPYLFLEIDKAKRKAREQGRDIIDFGVGDPDMPTPDYIIDSLSQAIRDGSNHRYALDQGIPELRGEISRWYQERFNVELDPQKEILPLIGSKEGLAHFPLAFLNPGDYALVPDPCYPPYKSATILAGGELYLMPLKEENRFLPELNKISSNTARKSKIMFINYPNNPTSAICDKDFYAELINFSQAHNIILVSDLAYSEISFDGFRPGSILELPGAKEQAIEFHSLSKTYNMTGWRIGFACGNKDLINALAKVKSNIDSGIFTAIQLAGVTALKGPGEHIEKMRQIYQQRRDFLIAGLKDIGFSLDSPKATFYIWLKVPREYSSISFAKLLLDTSDIIVTPGVGFGPGGEGYVRFALTIDKQRIKQAVERLKKTL